jgi:putative peptidase family protein
LKGRNEAALFENGAMRSTARVHLIQTDKTVREIQDLDHAQQNQSARKKDQIFDFFMDALKAHGSPFESSSRPVVAGLILDSHYSLASKMIVGHAALGCHQPHGISLGMFGSHLTYSWPRFLEEVTSCLLDTANPGDTVGNDCGDCGTMWEACSIGQGAFLHEVGHAFGADHTTGIMARGYARHWPRNFLVRTGYCSGLNQEGFVVVDGETENDARWDIREALIFRQQPQFWLPGDQKWTPFHPSVSVVHDPVPTMHIAAHDKIFRIELSQEKASAISVLEKPVFQCSFTLAELEKRFEKCFDHENPMQMVVLGANGKATTVRNIWRAFKQTESIRIPGSSTVIRKRSFTATHYEDNEEASPYQAKIWNWAVLLTRLNQDRKIEHATKVDIRTGCILDGAYVYFGNDRVNCGPIINPMGHLHTFGGHASESIDIPRGEEIVKIEVSRDTHYLRGVKVHLSNGEAKGALSGMGGDPETQSLGE